MKKMFSLMALAALLLGCSKSGGSDDPTNPGGGGGGEPLPGAVRTAGKPIAGTLVEKQIGTGGGEIAVAGNMTLQIPQGAFSKNLAVKVQRLMNTAPNGIDTMAYRIQFPATNVEKDFRIIYKLPVGSDGKPFVPGTDPVLLRLAMQDKATGIYNKLPGKPELTAAGEAIFTIPKKAVSTGDLDLAWFARFMMWVNASDNDKVAYHEVMPWQKSLCEVTTIPLHTDVEDLIVALPSERPVKTTDGLRTQEYINGEKNTVSKYGSIDPKETDHTFIYVAPRKLPNNETVKTVAVSCEFSPGLSKYILVCNFKIMNPMSLTIEGGGYTNMEGTVSYLNSNKGLSVGAHETDGGDIVNFSIAIKDVTGTGTFPINGLPAGPVDISAQSFLYAWEDYVSLSYKPEDKRYATGTVTITEFRKAKSGYPGSGTQTVVRGTYNGTLWRTQDGKFHSTGISGSFGGVSADTD